MNEEIEQMTDDELKAAFLIAKDDLAIASHEQNNSEWHQACFAGALIYAMEMQKRGITISQIH